MPGEEYATLVVGAGSAGCALAGRLAAAGHRVLVLEAGPTTWAPEILDVASLAPASPGHPANWDHSVELRPGHSTTVPRGRVAGGSGAVNGAVWCRATPADGWGRPGWTWADMLARYVRAERDTDLGDRPGHGDAGPVPVRRPAGALRHPAADRFLAAAAACGFPAEPDKNAGGAPGAGLVPSNAVDGVRVNPAMAYLHAPGLSAPAVRGDSEVATLLVDRDRVTGVVLRDGAQVRAAEVVLAAGALGTPLLLLRSGIGPADALRSAGLPVRADRPGVGRAFTDHPAVFLPFTTTDPPIHPHAPASQAALNLDAGADPAGDVEILLFARPFTPDGPLHLMCQLMAPDSRGTLTPTPDGPPRIAYHYLRTEHDRRRLRHAVRTAAELLRAGLGTRAEPPGEVLGSDRALDGWIAAHLTTAHHLCGTVPMGDGADGLVDDTLRVRGLDGLRVADTSVLPTAPRRGTAATAVAIGEAGAEFAGAGFTVAEPVGAGSPGAGRPGARTGMPSDARRRATEPSAPDGAGWSP